MINITINIILNIVSQYLFQFRFFFHKFPTKKIALFLLFFVSVVAMLLNVGLSSIISWQFFYKFNSLEKILISFYLFNILFILADKIGFKISTLIIKDRYLQQSSDPEFATYYVRKWFSIIWTTIIYGFLVGINIPIVIIINLL